MEHSQSEQTEHYESKKVSNIWSLQYKISVIFYAQAYPILVQFDNFHFCMLISMADFAALS